MEQDVILIRHAQSEWQTGKTKDRDSQITQLGIQQSLRLSKVLPEYLDLEKYTVFCSMMQRARQTSDVVLQGREVQVSFLGDLNEAYFHVRGSLNLSKHFINQVESSEEEDYLNYKDQVQRALGTMLSQSDRVMAITHGGFIKTVIRLFCGSDGFCSEIDNCSWSHFVRLDEGWVIKCLNRST